MKMLSALAGRTSTTLGSAANKLETFPLTRNTRPVPASMLTLCAVSAACSVAEGRAPEGVDATNSRAAANQTRCFMAIKI
jgi:hypothetical protein